MNVPLLDLQAQYLAIQQEIQQAVAEVFQSQHFILGPKVKACEEAIAQYSRCRFGVGVTSGTDALLICLMAENIGPGDEVITTPFTFFATVGSIVRAGAKPVFVDIDPVTYNIAADQIAAQITPRTRAIIPVHLYGQMADLDPILALAHKHGLIVIEDAAQAIGAEYKGRRAGSLGHYGCFSFFPSKNLGGAGDGGMVVTNDPQRAEKLACLRAHGSKPKYYHKFVGGNFRLDALQAAVVTAKLKYLDQWTWARQNNAQRYLRGLERWGVAAISSQAYARKASRSLDAQCVTPAVCWDRHIFNQFVIRVAQRDALKAHLKQQGVETEIYYPVPMHLQECFRSLGYQAGQFPESEAAARETLALPIYPELTEEQIEYVVKQIRAFLGSA